MFRILLLKPKQVDFLTSWRVMFMIKKKTYVNAAVKTAIALSASITLVACDGFDVDDLND